MNVLYGLHQPDEGEILLDGEKVEIRSSSRAIGLGIGMVHQHFMLVPVMTVAENLVLGAEPKNGPAAGLQGRRPSARASCRSASAWRSTRTPACRTSAWAPSSGWRSCARCSAARRCSCSTSRPRCSPPRRPRTCSRSCATLKAEGTGIIFISHKLNEVLDVADRITVLRRGEKVDTVPCEGATERSLATLMVGRDVLLRVEKDDIKPGEPLLSLRGRVGARRPRPARRARRVSLDVRAGEIVGLAGIDANGQSELIETIMGLRKPDEGTIMVAGRDVTHAGPRATLAAGVSHIAEDRHRRGLVLEFDLAENLALREYNTPAFSQARLPLAEEDGRPRAHAAEGVRRPRRRPGDPRRLAVGRQPAEGRDRARAQRRPAGDHRRPADARAGRGRDRVRAPAAGRGARRGPRACCSSRSRWRRSGP